MNQLVDVLLPSDEAEGTGGQVLKWLKAVGDRVVVDEPLLEIETDKVTVEVPSPCNGTLHEILKAEQSEVESGAVLGRIDIGQGTARPAAAVSASPPVAAARPATAEARQVTTPSGAGALSPAVRRLLAERGLEPTDVRGSGEGGKITLDDVLQHAAGTPRDAAAAPASSHPAPAQPASATAGRMAPHTRMRRLIAEHMVESMHTAPHVTTLFEADLSAVLAHRAQHQADFKRRGAPLTLTAYFLVACVDGLRAVPELNSRWTPEALEVFERIDIGVATALADGGLVVPVLRDVPGLDLFGIARGLADLVTRAREERLLPADLRGGTFTISNHGVSGSLLAAPIVINQPQSGILGIGKLEKRAVVLQADGQEQIGIRSRCYVTLTIDHRVLDGQRANQFLQVLTQRLEKWSG
jgi:2-oxoglutarate dehydrogenase E2 component (dihydrolipoamide succinyltransferase)